MDFLFPIKGYSLPSAQSSISNSHFCRNSADIPWIFAKFASPTVSLRPVVILPADSGKARRHKKKNQMRVLIINTSERTGGAAVAANRLMEALKNNGVKAKMLVRDKDTDRITVVAAPHGLLMQWRFLWERLVIFCRSHFSRKHLFEIDIANAGADVTALREFREADIVHLHWINQGMLSLGGIRKILDSGKPVVWTMHDMWPATGVCHLTMDCRKFTEGCCCCPLLPQRSLFGDLARQVWKRKRRLLYSQGRISFVTCSRWLASEARQSRLLEGKIITAIPNPIDTHVFCPGDKARARELLGLPQNRRLVLFVAQRVSAANKGGAYLVEACRQLAEERTELAESMGIVMLGGSGVSMADSFGVATYPLGYVSDTERIVAAYRAADLFVMPSLSENLPNTIMEAMACGVPCVGFRVGGIPEMIDHLKNGYVAAYKDAADLARGISWVLAEADHEALEREAVRKVAQCYSQQAVAMKYIEVYNQALAFKRYSL